MQAIQYLAVIGVLLSLLALAVVRPSGGFRSMTAGRQTLLGIIVGAIAATLVLVPAADVLPDQVESVLAPIVVGLCFAVATAIWYQFSRR